MLVCPKPTTHLHKFQQGNRLYVADLSQCVVLAIDKVVWEILDLCPLFSSEEIVEELGKKYGNEAVVAALNSLGTMEGRGLLFSNLATDRSVTKTDASRRLKILVLQSERYAADITRATGGVSVAHHNLIKSLEAYTSLDVVGEHDEKFNEHVQSIRYQRSDRATLLKLIGRNYDAVLLDSHQNTQFLSFLRYVDAPFVVPIYSARGHNGDVINAGLLWYAAMRPFDAFLVPTNSVRDLYDRFVCDKDIFHTVFLGVDHNKFQPLDKQRAKNEVARMLNKPEIATSSVVGFFSRFQPEKGAGIYIKIAKLLPNACFLLTAPTLNFYAISNYPRI